MEISELYTAPRHEKGAEVQLRDPDTKEPLECWITVCGVDSKTFRESQQEAKRSIIESIRDKKDVDNDELKTIVDCSIGWRGFLDKGKEIKFSKKAVRTLYENSPLIAQQIDNFIVDRKNFTKG